MRSLTLEQMFPSLTTVTCESSCCHGETYLDEVGLVIVCDAVRAFDWALTHRAATEARKWEEAHERAAAALAAARAGRTAGSLETGVGA